MAIPMSRQWPAQRITLFVYNHNHSGPSSWSDPSPQSVDAPWSPDETFESQGKLKEESPTAVISDKLQEDNGPGNNQDEEEEEQSWYLGPGGSRAIFGPSPLPPDSRGMFVCLSPQHKLRLARCLLESHAFAKRFNSNDEQRNVLFEAGECAHVFLSIPSQSVGIISLAEPESKNEFLLVETNGRSLILFS